jgi:DNA-binding MarR family transcriptional regulator
MEARPIIVSEVIDDIRRIFQVIKERSKKVEAETQLTGSQLWVIKILSESPSIKVSELASRMYLHPATMVGLLDRLESKGLVKRARSEKDRRVVHVELTPQGRSVVESSPEVVQRLLVSGLERLSDHDLKETSEGLHHIVKILGVENAPPQLIMSTELNLPEQSGMGPQET